MAAQGFDDRATTKVSLTGARFDQRFKGLPDTQQLLNLVVDVRELRGRARAHVRRIGIGIGPKLKELLDLAQGKTQLLGLTDEPDTLDRLVGIGSKPAGYGLHGLPNKALALVETNSLYANTSVLCSFADRQWCYLRHA